MDAVTHAALSGRTPLGERQYEVIRRAQMSTLGMVMPAGFLERRACRRLVARGIFVPAIGFPDVWKFKEDTER